MGTPQSTKGLSFDPISSRGYLAEEQPTLRRCRFASAVSDPSQNPAKQSITCFGMMPLTKILAPFWSIPAWPKVLRWTG